MLIGGVPAQQTTPTPVLYSPATLADMQRIGRKFATCGIIETVRAKR
jgi:hypothetical protein